MTRRGGVTEVHLDTVAQQTHTHTHTGWGDCGDGGGGSVCKGVCVCVSGEKGGVRGRG